MGVVEIVVSAGGGLLIAFLAWFFFAPTAGRSARPTLLAARDGSAFARI